MFSRTMAWPIAASSRSNLLRALGADVVVSECVPEGRAALSQGMIATAKNHAKRATAELDRYVTEGRDIVVVEPSSLSMFRRDMRHLIDSKDRFERFRSRAYDPVEYVIKVLEKTDRKPADVFDASHSPVGTKIFFHAHCQQKTIGAAAPTEKLLREIGFDVLTSNVECCGMAGSFGYKTDYYDLSMAVGADLFNQIIQQERAGGERALIASGTSCTEQLQGGFDAPGNAPNRTPRPNPEALTQACAIIAAENLPTRRPSKRPAIAPCARPSPCSRSSPIPIATAANTRDSR